jgi:thioredoxin-related protein
MKNWQKKLDVITNLALLLCCIIFLTFLIQKYFIKEYKPDNKSSEINIEKLSSLGIDWSGHSKTLVIVLQKGCRFCEESMSFYQRLNNEFASQENLHLVIVLDENKEEALKYLKDKKVEGMEILQSTPMSLGVRGTPTLLLIDNGGNIVKQWVGKLPSSGENDVFERLRS